LDEFVGFVCVDVVLVAVIRLLIFLGPVRIGIFLTQLGCIFFFFPFSRNFPNLDLRIL
jgi:hypothetical protein